MEHLVLGISGSPVPRSNTDRAVQTVLTATGLPTKFVKLSDYNLEPCRACLGCLETNTCVVADDGRELAEMFRAASAFVLGAFTPYSSLDARSKAFMERMYCLRHQTGLNRGKVGAAVITTACQPGAPQLPPAAETAGAQIAFWMMEEGITAVGTMVLLGNVPCIRCGHGDQCEMSGVRMLHGPDATVESVGVQTFGDDPASLTEAKALGQQIRVALGL
ncbi:MAG: flavodoxin family protein [Fimbriimonadaceae bacterium]|nr:flavodoxin family protein [Fimbriimonadaceae bacterium]